MRLLTGSESDNRFSFFKAWLVCMGKAVYEAALVDPDSLADVVDPNWEHDYTPGFCGAGDNARRVRPEQRATVLPAQHRPVRPVRDRWPVRRGSGWLALLQQHEHLRTVHDG